MPFAPRGFLVCIALLSPACAALFPAPTPMTAVDHPAPSNPHPTQAKCLLVFLPGRGDSAENFAERGFVAEVQRRKLSVDVVAADASLGYYLRGTVSQRLFLDVIRPRLYRDYQEIWLVGMSMGGLGTLMYPRQRPGEISGVLALAPYLGSADLTDEIRAQGGLARWRAPERVEPLNEHNYQREIWRWLQAVNAGREAGPIVYLGYGTEDRLAAADSLLAADLPKDRVYTAPGGHNWDVWRGLLVRFLDQSDFASRCR
jgi:pimeloyl-ACP methyl ester carboxylesterase